jgi:hypothetical protein
MAPSLMQSKNIASQRDFQPLLGVIGSQWKPFMAEGSRSRTYQEASDAPSWV